MHMIWKIFLLAALAGPECCCSHSARGPVNAPQKVSATDGPHAPSASAAIESYQGEPQPAEVSRTEPPAGEGILKREPITVLIKADPQLNRFQRNAHALFLCLYQLKDPNGFNQLLQEKDGIPKLIACNRFDATVANARQFVIQPGQELKEVRDRAEGGRYVGIATGYYGLGREKVTGLSPLPALRGSDPSGCQVHIELGPYEITSMKVK
jgi:predicted component of type VI protein secretion system